MGKQERCPCGGIILADTEEWPVMLCADHYEDAMHIAARVWCDEANKTTEMDAALATGFAKRLGPLLAALEHVVNVREYGESFRVAREALAAVEASD